MCLAANNRKLHYRFLNKCRGGIFSQITKSEIDVDPSTVDMVLFAIHNVVPLILLLAFSLGGFVGRVCRAVGRGEERIMGTTCCQCHTWYNTWVSICRIFVPCL